jgi:hypothetical protein
MTLMTIRLELGRTTGFPNGDSSHGYEFLAPLTEDGHIDRDVWAQWKDDCLVRRFQPGHPDGHGLLRHVGRGWRFDFDPSRSDDDEPFYKLDRHTISPGLYVSLTEPDGVQRPFKIVSVMPAGRRRS